MREDLVKISIAIDDFVAHNEVTPTFDEDLKDYLADLKDANKISYCGCEGLFISKHDENTTTVFMDLAGKIYKFAIMKGEPSRFTGSCHTEALEGTGAYEIPEDWDKLLEE